MFFLDNFKKITREDELYKYIIQTKSNLQKMIEIQYAKKSMLTQILDKIANVGIEQIKMNNTKALLFLIEETKTTLDRINDNLPGLNELLDEINDIINKINEYIQNKTYDKSLCKAVEYFYILYNEKINIIAEINLSYESIMADAYEYFISTAEDTFNIQTGKISLTNKKDAKFGKEKKNDRVETKEDDENNIFDSNMKEKNEKEFIKIEENVNKDEKIEIKKGIECKEKEEKIQDNNILRISEIDNKVYLPYRVYDLERMLNENPGEYKSMSDIIDEEYIVPLEKYKNSAFSRFKEAYNLMRFKEQGSFSEAIDLALEVTFKNTLNPAVISACKDLDELDNYLDCLEENKLNDFKAFKIEYEGFPDIKR